jgi:TfoX/Sxy family transcriptional regulator of competence genes
VRRTGGSPVGIVGGRCHDLALAYDEQFAQRVRAAVHAADPGPFEEKRIFGGVAMMLAGNMSVAVPGGGGLMVRVDPAQADQFAAEPGAAQAEMNGRVMRGGLVIEAAALAKDADLRRWVKRGISYARTLPAK